MTILQSKDGVLMIEHLVALETRGRGRGTRHLDDMVAKHRAFSMEAF